MRNYIIRIYRCEKDNPRHLIGTVESVEDERRSKRAFTNFEDLWGILNSEIPESAVPKQRKSKKVNDSRGEIREPMTKVVLDVRNLSREARVLLVRYTIPKVNNGEIMALADDENAIADISRAARSHGWLATAKESEGIRYQVTIRKRRDLDFRA